MSTGNGFVQSICADCWGTGIQMDGSSCQRCTFYHPIWPTNVNWDNKTKVFDPQQEIKALKERLKKLEEDYDLRMRVNAGR